MTNEELNEKIAQDEKNNLAELDYLLNIDARQMLQMRLDILRKYRAKKLSIIDNNIKIAEDQNDKKTVSELKEKRQKWRDITEPYKAMLAKEGKIKVDQNDPILCLEWDIFNINP